MRSELPTFFAERVDGTDCTGSTGRGYSDSLIPVGKATLRVRRIGRGQVVVCLHAIGHDGRDFIDFAQRHRDRLEFVLVDWPGHGASPHDGVPPSVHHYGSLTGGLLAVLGIDRAFVIGNSIGGGAAIVAATADPKRIAGLVLCDTAGLVRPTLFSHLYCLAQSRFYNVARRGPEAFSRAFRQLYENKVLPGAAVVSRREEIIAGAPAVAPLIRQAWQGFATAASDLRAAAASLTQPVLVVWAKYDRVNRLGFSRAALRRIPRSRLLTVGGGHVPFLEAPVEFDAAFAAFVADAVPASEPRSTAEPSAEEHWRG